MLRSACSHHPCYLAGGMRRQQWHPHLTRCPAARKAALPSAPAPTHDDAAATSTSAKQAAAGTEASHHAPVGPTGRPAVGKPCAAAAGTLATGVAGRPAATAAAPTGRSAAGATGKSAAAAAGRAASPPSVVSPVAETLPTAPARAAVAPAAASSAVSTASAAAAPAPAATVAPPPKATVQRLHVEMDIGQAINAVAQATGRVAGAAEEQLAERLRSNWYSTAADVAGMTQDELQVLKVPIKLWHLLRAGLQESHEQAAAAVAPVPPESAAATAAGAAATAAGAAATAVGAAGTPITARPPAAAGATAKLGTAGAAPAAAAGARTAAAAAPRSAQQATAVLATAQAAAAALAEAAVRPAGSMTAAGGGGGDGASVLGVSGLQGAVEGALGPQLERLPEDIMQRRMPDSSKRKVTVPRSRGKAAAAAAAAIKQGGGGQAAAAECDQGRAPLGVGREPDVSSSAAAAAAAARVSGPVRGAQAAGPAAGASAALQLGSSAARAQVGAPAVRRKRLRSTEAYGLKDSELTDSLRKELAGLQRFCTTCFYGQQVPPMRAVTYNTVVAFYMRLMLGWLHHAQRIPLPQLSLRALLPTPKRESASLLMQYMQWREAQRGCSVSSHTNAIKACIVLARFLYHDQSKPDPDRCIPPYHDIELVQELSRMMRTAQKASSRAPRVADESKKWLEWQEYLGLVRSLKAECAGLTAGGLPRSRKEVAASLQRYLIFAILSVIPDRQRTLRELEVGRTLLRDEQGSWVIRHGPDDYKTGKQYGERPPMVLPPFLYPELNAFIEVWRAELQPQHLGLFCRLCDGKQLTTKGLTSLFKAAAMRLTGRATNPHLVRDMVVTNLRSQGCSEVEMESLALFMGHSLKMQRDTYDRRTHAQRVAPAQELLLGMAARRAGGAGAG